MLYRIKAGWSDVIDGEKFECVGVFYGSERIIRV